MGSRTYAAFTTLVRQKLNQTATTIYSVADINNAIVEGLKEYSTYVPHIVPVRYQIESRYGTCSTTSASNLVDTPKGQFLTDDATNEKVVHNTKDNTYAVVTSVASTAQVGLSGDIFVKDENYRIYNKRCWNNKQVFVGDLADFSSIDSVEYPIGQRRNWRLLDGDNVLELDVDTVEDSNSGTTVTQLPNIDVLVRWQKPHVLSQMSDVAGRAAATAAVGATSIATSALAAATIYVGDEFTIQYHRSAYQITAQTTVTGSTCTISFYPGLERAVASTTWTITFVASSLRPKDEEIFADLAAARAAINKAPLYANTTTTSPDAMSQYMDWGEARLREVLSKLERSTPPRTKRRWPTA